MAYDLKNLKGEFKKRNNSIEAGQRPVMEISDDELKRINDGFDPVRSLGIVMGEDGKVPVKDGIPRIFIMQPNENGIDTMMSLDAANIKPGSREFWSEAQKGNIFAFPGGSEKPVQVQLDLQPMKVGVPKFSAPVDMQDERTLPASANYRKPGRLVRFINRFIPGFRRRDCEIYKERQKFDEIARTRAAGMKQEMKDLKVAEKEADHRAEKAQQKENLESIERHAGLLQHGREFYRDLVAPTPKFHEEHERILDNKGNVTQKGHYTREEFNAIKPIDKKYEDYSVGGKPISQDEYCGLVDACAHDGEHIMEVFKKTNRYDPLLYDTMKNMGYSDKTIMNNIAVQCSTFLADDQMKGDLRDNQGEVLGVGINNGRIKAFDVLEQYKAGNVQPLAEKIKSEVERVSSCSSDITAGELQNGARNGIHFCTALIGLMDRDPKLKDAVMKAGLKQDDIDAVKGLNEYGKAVDARDKAKVELAKAAYEDRHLSEEKKHEYAKDILTANLMESKIFVENNEFANSGRTVVDEGQRLQAKCMQDGMYDPAMMKKGNEGKKGDRPLPPEGKFYFDQADKIASGFKHDFNEHPETVIQLSDAENVEYFKELADGVAEKNGLSYLNEKDLLKKLDGSTELTGAKLVEQADKVAQDLKYKELGLDELIVDKEAEKLNKTVDYGDNSNVIGGPMA